MSESEMTRVMRDLAKRKWAKMTPEQRKAHIAAMVKARLAKKGEK